MTQEKSCRDIKGNVDLSECFISAHPIKVTDAMMALTIFAGKIATASEFHCHEKSPRFIAELGMALGVNTPR